eukprot:PhM_4_TR4766/c0_g1_i1/m.12126/K20195/MON1; vacuolar fusion protein MON1
MSNDSVDDVMPVPAGEDEEEGGDEDVSEPGAIDSYLYRSPLSPGNSHNNNNDQGDGTAATPDIHVTSAADGRQSPLSHTTSMPNLSATPASVRRSMCCVDDDESIREIRAKSIVIYNDDEDANDAATNNTNNNNNGNTTDGDCEGEGKKQTDGDDSNTKDEAHSTAALDMTVRGSLPGRIHSTREWRDRRKHFLIVSASGRPVFTRYGDECAMSDLFGIVQVMISMGESRNEMLRRAVAGDVQICFLQMGELAYMVVARTGETFASYQQQMRRLHHQIESIIPNVDQILKKKQTFDLRRFIGEADVAVLHGLIHAMNVDPGYYFEAVHPVRLPKPSRQLLTTLLHNSTGPQRSEDILFSLVLMRRSVAQLVSYQKHSLHPSDVLLLINYINTSPSIQKAETWFPLCFPTFSPGGFLWIYVKYFDSHVALVHVSASQESFEHLSKAQETFRRLMAAAAASPSNSTKTNVMMQLQKRATAPVGDFHVSDIGLSELRHVLYVTSGQYIASTWPVLAAQNMKEQKRIIRGYVQLRATLRTSGSTARERIATQDSQSECMVVQTTHESELYMLFAPMTPKRVLSLSATRVRRFLKQFEEELFLSQK